MTELTEKDLKKILKNIKGMEGPDRFPINPEASERIGFVVTLLQNMDNKLTIIFGDVEYTLKLSEKKAENATPLAKLMEGK